MQVNEKRLVDTFLELVRTDSESFHEKNIQDLLVKKLKALGCSVYVDNAGSKYETDAKGNIIASFKGTKKSRPMILSCHMDTVPPGCGIKPIVKKDRITSDGTTILGGDDKAGIAIILEVLASLKEQKIPHAPLEVVFTLTEESGMRGAKNLDYKKIKSREGLILDNEAYDELLIQGPCVSDVEVWIKGVPAHAGVCPEKGISALELAAKALASMKLGRIDKETVANFAIIKGGAASNIVTEDIFIKGEARSLNEAKLKKQLAHMKSCFDKTAKLFVKKVDGKVLRPQIKFVTSRRYGAVCVAKNAPIVKLVTQSAKEQGVKLRACASGGGCDANVLSDFGFTLPNLGVGVQKCHTTAEYLELKPFFTAFKIVMGTVLKYQK